MLVASRLRSNLPEVFLGKCVLRICSKFTGEHPCRRVISTKLLCNFIEITLRHGYSPVNLLQIFRTPFHKNTYGRLLLRAALGPFSSFLNYINVLRLEIKYSEELSSNYITILYALAEVCPSTG